MSHAELGVPQAQGSPCEVLDQAAAQLGEVKTLAAKWPAEYLELYGLDGPRILQRTVDAQGKVAGAGDVFKARGVCLT